MRRRGRIDRNHAEIALRKIATALVNLDSAAVAMLAKRMRLQIWRCRTCKKEEPRTVHQARKTYCSKACMAKDYKTRLRGAGNGHFTAASEKLCENCGSVYHSYQKNRRFCSFRCYVTAEDFVRGRARKDSNHADIVDAITKVGGRVLDLSSLGNGVPDLVVLTRCGIQLAEVKNPVGTYGKKASPRQKTWASAWLGGPVFILRTQDDAINLVAGKFEAVEKIDRSMEEAFKAVGI